MRAGGRAPCGLGYFHQMLNHTEYFTRLHCEITTWLLCNEFFILAALLLSPNRSSLSPSGPRAGTSGSIQPVILARDTHTCAQGPSTVPRGRGGGRGGQGTEVPLQTHCTHPTPRSSPRHKMPARGAAPRFYAGCAAQPTAYSPSKGSTTASGPPARSTCL